MESRAWSVILAGGAGTRPVGVTGGVPKQFWQPDGGLSLLEETLGRVGTLTPPKQCAIVVHEAHREYISRSALGGAHVVAQPDDRGTAAGVLYGLLTVLSFDPQAVVLITPADHGVENPSLFLSAIRKALTHVTSRDGIMLLGVAPSMADTDHGWIAIAPGGSATGVHRVAGFFEEPSLSTADRLLKLGSLVNTMVVAARARTLLDLCRKRVPDLTAHFVEALTLPRDIRDGVLRAAYAGLQTYDFSRHVLSGAAGLLALRIPEAAGWSDLGTPDRVAKWLAARHESVFASPHRQTIASTRLVAEGVRT